MKYRVTWTRARYDRIDEVGPRSDAAELFEKGAGHRGEAVDDPPSQCVGWNLRTRSPNSSP
jgi:hypothetical protein